MNEQFDAAKEVADAREAVADARLAIENTTAHLQRLAVVTSAYTGVLCAPSFAPVHKYAEELLGRPVYTHEFADEALMDEIKERAKPEFIRLWGLTR